MIREALGWERDRWSAEIGLGTATWYSYANSRRVISIRVSERIREVTGIDPYVLAYCLYADYSKLPDPIQELLGKLRKEWEDQLDMMKHCRHLLPTWKP